MPELPEVEVIRLFLHKHLIGKRIISLETITPKSFSGDPSLIFGQTVTFLGRTGKHLSITLSNNFILLAHLKMTGQLIYHPSSSIKSKNGISAFGHPTKDMLNQSLPNKSTRLVFHFSNGSRLFFNDQRKFGWIKLMTQVELAQFQKNLGVDILSPRFTAGFFYHQIHSSSRPIKLLLLDQSRFAGIGNIYANDALFLAGLHPQTPAKTITRPDALRLRRFLISIMRQSIRHGGSTARDNTFLRPDRSAGSHQFHFRVYQRAGLSCFKCGNFVQKIKLGGRGTFFCPVCQKSS